MTKPKSLTISRAGVFSQGEVTVWDEPKYLIAATPVSSQGWKEEGWRQQVFRQSFHVHRAKASQFSSVTFEYQH